mgnify:CR=1 FL=1
MQGMAYRYQNDDVWTLLYVSEGSQELTGYNMGDFMSMKIRMETHLLHEDYVDLVWKEIIIIRGNDVTNHKVN